MFDERPARRDTSMDNGEGSVNSRQSVLLRCSKLVICPGTGNIVSASFDERELDASHIVQAQNTNEQIVKSSTLQFQANENELILPGLIDLHTNGLVGIHFTSLTSDNYEQHLATVAREMAKNGVTAWFATVPTVEEHKWKEILPLLAPRSFDDVGGSPLLGAHVEGPYLHPSKKGAHNSAYFKTPLHNDFQSIYGEENLQRVIKMITVAPELDGALEMIADIRRDYPHIRISIGHSTATYEQGRAAIQAGATSLTHVFNAMNPLQHRDPGLPGLISQMIESAPLAYDSSIPSAITRTYFTMIPDLVHLHPAVLRLLHQSDTDRCILITDSIELAGLPDGIYEPNGQITYPQRKAGNRATNIADTSRGEVETLIGSCITLIDAVRNMVHEAGLDYIDAFKCASTNVANFMNLHNRGSLENGKRADFVVVDKDMRILQTWISGKCVWRASTSQ